MEANSVVKRLGLNKGRYHGEGLDIGEYLREFHAAAQTRHWIPEKFAAIDGFDLHGYRRSPANPRRTIYISSGIHGDEPAAPVALRRLVDEDRWPADTAFILCPCLNPTGFTRNTRENKDCVDLNRDYRSRQSAEVRAHIAWLDTLPNFDFSLILHEDWEADGFYIYEVNFGASPGLAESILQNLRDLCPIQPTSVIDGLWQCVNGIVRPTILPQDRPLWAEAVYLIAAGKTKLSLTLEAPSDFPLPFRAEAHVRAVNAALA